MALVFEKFNLAVKIADSGGNIGSMNFRISGIVTETAKLTADAIVAEVQALTDGAVVGYSFTSTYSEDANYLGAAGSQVENVAQVNFRLQQSATPDGPIGKWGSIRIPAPKQSLFLATTGKLSNTINPANAALRDLLERYDGNLTYTVTTSDGQLAEDVTAEGNVNGHRIHRKSSKG